MPSVRVEDSAVRLEICSLGTTVAGFDTRRPCPADLTSGVPPRTTSDPIAAAFGQAVRSAREARGETLETVAGRVPKLDPSYLAGIERGAHAATIPSAARIASALGMTLSELVRQLDAPSEPREGAS